MAPTVWSPRYAFKDDLVCLALFCEKVLSVSSPNPRHRGPCQFMLQGCPSCLTPCQRVPPTAMAFMRGRWPRMADLRAASRRTGGPSRRNRGAARTLFHVQRSQGRDFGSCEEGRPVFGSETSQVGFCHNDPASRRGRSRSLPAQAPNGYPLKVTHYPRYHSAKQDGTDSGK